MCHLLQHLTPIFLSLYSFSWYQALVFPYSTNHSSFYSFPPSHYCTWLVFWRPAPIPGFKYIVLVLILILKIWKSTLSYHWDKSWDFIFLGSKITADGDCSHGIKRCLLLGRKVMTNLDHLLKKQRHYFANKGLSSQSCGFSSSPIWMWELDYKESWVLKKWCLWTAFFELLEKTLESPSDSKEIQPVCPKGNQSWILIGRTDAEAETTILWPPDGKNWLIWKDPDAGKDWRQKRGDNRGWDGWMASPTQWTWVWVNSGSWWWMGRPGMLQSVGLQRVRHDWVAKLNQSLC